MDSPVVRFCTSCVAGKLCAIGLNRHLEAWNNHRIPGITRGIPKDLARRNCRTYSIDSTFLPTADHAVMLYESSGGHLTRNSEFGIDPLRDNLHLIAQRQRKMERILPNPEHVFSCTVNYNYQPHVQKCSTILGHDTITL